MFFTPGNVGVIYVYIVDVYTTYILVNGVGIGEEEGVIMVLRA